LLLVQMTAALGAWATLLGASLVHRQGVLLALAAGTFLYIALVELMPDVLRSAEARGKSVRVAEGGQSTVELVAIPRGSQ